MSVDRYTKAILTVIAVCLVRLSVGGTSLITPVSAQSNQRALSAGWVDGDGKVRPIYAASGAAGQSLPLWIVIR